MKAIRTQRPGVVALEELPMPEPQEGEVRIRTAYCGICATDLVMIAGWERTPCPATPGHEWSGIVDGAGAGVNPDIVGRRCVGENVVPCGDCAACRQGRCEACTRSREVGFELPGGYAEYFITRAANLRFLSDSVPLSTATLTEPLAVVTRGITRLHNDVPAGPTLIMGDGPIGLLMALALHEAGIKEIALVGGRAHKLALAKAFGIARTWSYKMQKAELPDLLRTTAPEGFGLGVEASGSPDALGLLLDVTANDAEVLVLGDYGNSIGQLPLANMVTLEMRLVGSNSGAGAWDAAVEFFERHHETMARMITHQFAAEDFDAALDSVKHRRDECIKAVLRWGAG